MNGHQFLQFLLPMPRRRIVREVAVSLMNRYLNASTPLSRTKLLKIPRARIPCWTAAADGSDRREWESKPICVEDVELELETGSFDFQKFELFDPGCDWLDPAVVASPAFHVVDSDGEVLKFKLPTSLGSRFPLVPLLDREGTAISSPQRGIQQQLLLLRTRLVENSGAFAEAAWFQDLRMVASECVSLIDVTLHQFYYKAKYDPLPGWTFDEKRLDPPHGLRLARKLEWIHQITRRDLNPPKDEYAAFHEIKDLRNHLQHFDPPCFCFSLEETARWLNLVTLVARFAWRIRLALNSPLSVDLIRLILAPDVQFVPLDHSRARAVQAPETGYASSRWPTTPT